MKHVRFSPLRRNSTVSVIKFPACRLRPSRINLDPQSLDLARRNGEAVRRYFEARHPERREGRFAEVLARWRTMAEQAAADAR